MGDGLRRPARPSCAGGKRWAVGAYVALALAAAPSACGSKNGEAEGAMTPSSDDEAVSLVPVACGKDQVREYRCDALLPLSSSLPAPEPYEACPGVIDIVSPTYVPLAKTASFDAVHTEFMRRRAPPGHQCCYSWCARLEARSTIDVPPGGRCNEPLAFPEKHCIPEPEGRISKEPAAPPFDRCPAALRPPKAAVFSVPAAAAFHPGLTTERRNQGFGECCYAWCSIAPPGTGLERGR